MSVGCWLYSCCCRSYINSNDNNDNDMFAALFLFGSIIAAILTILVKEIESTSQSNEALSATPAKSSARSMKKIWHAQPNLVVAFGPL